MCGFKKKMYAIANESTVPDSSLIQQQFKPAASSVRIQLFQTVDLTQISTVLHIHGVLAKSQAIQQMSTCEAESSGSCCAPKAHFTSRMGKRRKTWHGLFETSLTPSLMLAVNQALVVRELRDGFKASHTSFKQCKSQHLRGIMQKFGDKAG